MILRCVRQHRMVYWIVIISFCTSHDKHTLYCSNIYNENDAKVPPGFVNSPISTQVYIWKPIHEIHDWNIIQTARLQLTFFLLHKGQCVPQNSALCRFHTITKIWNYFQYPPPTVFRWIIEKIVVPSQNAKRLPLFYEWWPSQVHLR